MRAASLASVTLDLLSYYGNGNYGLFERSFNRALSFLEIDERLEESDRRKYRNRVFHFLRALGYIEVVHFGGETTWSVPPPAIVQRSSNSFVLMGTTKSKELLEQKLVSVKFNFLESGDFVRDLGVHLGLELMEVDSTLLTLQKECGKEFPIYPNYQDCLFNALPSLKTVYQKVLVELPDYPSLDIARSQRYFSDSSSWRPIEEGRITEPGLYKTQFLNKKSDFFLIPKTGKYKKWAYRFFDPEWDLVCLYGKLGYKLRLRYLEESKDLSIERIGQLNLPTLLERCLRSGTMMSPSVSRQWTTYGGINARSFWQLVGKFPIFQVETA